MCRQMTHYTTATANTSGDAMAPLFVFYLIVFFCSFILPECTRATEEETTRKRVQNEEDEQTKNAFITRQTVFFSSPCPPRDDCGKFRSRMHNIHARNDKCRDGCKFTPFFFLSPKRRGWECGSCQEWVNSYRGFDATLIFRNVKDPAVREIFLEAAARWETVVIGDLPSQRIPKVRKGPFASECTLGTMPTVVDDVLVCVALNEIDGKGSVLARASAAYRRRHSGLTVYGSMIVDAADLGGMIDNMSLKGVVMHEMAHVLGLNPFSWKKKGLINSRTPQCHYKVQSAASRAWQNVTGCGPEYAVPIENGGGPGTACAHFEERCLGAELMTGYITNAQLPLSIITVGALEDLGYTVDYTAADNFTSFSCTSECDVPTRRVRRRNLFEEDTGYQLALQYGKEFLQNQTLDSNDEKTLRLLESEEGLEYIGDQYVSIVYLDDFGALRHVELCSEKDVSDTGYQLVLQYGKDFLHNQTFLDSDDDEETRRLVENEEGIEFIGDQYVSIVYLEKFGTWRHVEVTSDMVT